MSDYLHGVETVNVGDAPKSISEVKTSIIGIVGTANPSGVNPADFKVNEPQLLLDPADIEGMVGKVADGYSLPKYLPKIYEQFEKKNAMIIVINTLPLTDSPLAVKAVPQGGLVDLEKLNVCGVVVTSEDGGTTYTEGAEEDYTVNYDTGIVAILNAETSVKVGFKYGDIDAVVADDIAGATTPARTGIYALLDAKSILSYTPRIIGAPGYAEAKAVADALKAVANKTRARFYVDADIVSNTTLSENITARSESDQAFITHEKRGTILYPGLKNAGAGYAASAAAMGVRARTDMDSSMGYHWPISSRKINGFDGLSTPVEYSISDPSAESQLLNAAGIVTIKNVGGQKFCGNENSSFDLNNAGNNDHEIFETTMTVGDVIEESIEYYSEGRIDQPMTPAWVTGIVRDVRRFLRNLKGRKVILGGTCWYEPSKNDTADLAAGKIKFSYDDAATPPNNKLTFERAYNVSYLSNIGG